MLVRCSWVSTFWQAAWKAGPTGAGADTIYRTLSAINILFSGVRYFSWKASPKILAICCVEVAGSPPSMNYGSFRRNSAKYWYWSCASSTS